MLDIVCLIKSDDSNAFTLTLELHPENLEVYQKTDWIKGFQTQSLSIQPV